MKLAIIKLRYLAEENTVLLPENWEEFTLKKLIEISSKPIFDYHYKCGSVDCEINDVEFIGVLYVDYNLSGFECAE